MKRLLLFFVVMLAAICSQASYLYWQVSADTISDDTYLKSHITGDLSQYAAQIRYGGEGTGIYDYGTLAKSDGGTMSAIGGASYSIDLDTLGDPTGYSFYVEIFKYENNALTSVARSETQSYASLQNGHFIVDLMDMPNMQVWTGGASYTIPEPNSALLIMVGMAMLGLKRRRV